MSWGVKTTCLEAPGVSLGGSGVSIGGVGSLRVPVKTAVAANFHQLETSKTQVFPVAEKKWCEFLLFSRYFSNPIGSMGRTAYLPIHEWLIFMVNVCKYTIHGSYGNRHAFIVWSFRPPKKTSRIKARKERNSFFGRHFFR